MCVRVEKEREREAKGERGLRPPTGKGPLPSGDSPIIDFVSLKSRLKGLLGRVSRIMNQKQRRSDIYVYICINI
jgi:hypothetical protein